MTTWLTGARRRDLSSFVTNGLFAPNGLYGVCLHVNVSESGTPINFWGPGNNASVVPNFQVFKDGTVDQMLPFNRQPWCQVDGNTHYAAIETAGLPTEPLTVKQMNTIARILKIYHDEYGVPLQLADKPGDRGFITHSAGGQAWGGHSCPGPIRALQRAAILSLAQPKEVFDLSQAQYDAIMAELKNIETRVINLFCDWHKDAKGEPANRPHRLLTWFQGIPGYKQPPQTLG